MVDHERAKRALGEWLALTPAERASAGLPATQREFAERWSLATRTVIRWKQNDALVAETYRRAGERLTGGLHDPGAEPPTAGPQKRQGAPPRGFLPGAGSRPSPDLGQGMHTLALDEGDPASAEFDDIRSNIASAALRGDQKALDTYMRWFGSEFLEEQRAQRESSFADMSDEQLVDGILSLIGRPAVERWYETTAALEVA